MLCVLCGRVRAGWNCVQTACRATRGQAAAALKLCARAPRARTVHESLNDTVDITCIDFSANEVVALEGISNDGVAQFLAAPRPSWSRVRWINVDGMSWDVIQVGLGAGGCRGLGARPGAV